MRSSRVDGGRISQRCVLRVSKVAKYSPKAFPGTHPWQDFRLMYDKRGLGRKNTPLCGNISPICIQNELVLARFTHRVSKKPCKPLFGNTHSENLARKGPFSVRGLQTMHSKLILPSRFPNQRKSPAPDRLHLQSSEQSAMPPTSYLLKHKKRRPGRVAFQFWHRSEKPTEGNRG